MNCNIFVDFYEENKRTNFSLTHWRGSALASLFEGGGTA